MGWCPPFFTFKEPFCTRVVGKIPLRMRNTWSFILYLSRTQLLSRSYYFGASVHRGEIQAQPGARLSPASKWPHHPWVPQLSWKPLLLATLQALLTDGFWTWLPSSFHPWVWPLPSVATEATLITCPSAVLMVPSPPLLQRLPPPSNQPPKAWPCRNLLPLQALSPSLLIPSLPAPYDY